MTSDELTHLDLFSGIGGFSLAAQWAGFRTVGFSEVEPYACRVLAERFPGVPNVGDVRITANFARFRGRVDVLAGGFPCQPWSLAGQRRGAGDDRHLWPAMCDVIETVRPAFVICENVPGLISVGLEPVCLDLESLGYSTQPFVVPACAVGAIHRRDRVWIVAHADGQWKLQPQGREREERGRAGNGGADVADAVRNGSAARISGQVTRQEGHAGKFDDAGSESGGAHFWLPEPSVGRVAHGIPHRAHRLRGLGNSIVPQVAEQFFRFIAQIERGEVTA